MEPGGDGTQQRLAVGALEVRLDLLDAQAVERQPPRHARELGEDRCELADAAFALAVGADHEHSRLRSDLCQEAKQEQRGLVGRV
jgi:hypothetical protein